MFLCFCFVLFFYLPDGERGRRLEQGWLELADRKRLWQQVFGDGFGVYQEPTAKIERLSIGEEKD